jgi:hypothetical protein
LCADISNQRWKHLLSTLNKGGGAKSNAWGLLLLQLGCKLWWDLGNEKDSLGEFDSDPAALPLFVT